MSFSTPAPGEQTEGSGAGMFTGGTKAATLNLLNLFTYYTMRHRAGVIGCKGVNPLLHKAKQDHPNLKLHLIGHSFGARLVTSTVSGCGSPLTVDSLTLLQGAFSHYGFAENYEGGRNGQFHDVLADGLVEGPILITHTRNDRAVGIAYALASRLARQHGAALGDENDLYGGMGSNGAQKTRGSVTLTLGEAVEASKGKVFNLNSDTVIKSHSDIVHAEVAKTFLAAAGLNT